MLYSLLGENATREEVAAVLNSIGVIYREQGRRFEAEFTFQKAHKILMKIFRENGDSVNMARSFGILGLVHCDKGEGVEAKSMWNSSLEKYHTCLGENAWAGEIAMTRSYSGG